MSEYIELWKTWTEIAPYKLNKSSKVKVFQFFIK